MKFSKSFLMVTGLSMAIFNISKVKSQVSWDIITSPVVLGRSVTLRCVVPNNTSFESNPCHWTGGPSYKLIGMNGISMNNSKYNIMMNNISFSFYMYLVIYNVSYSDLDCDYTCGCGFAEFNKNLSITRNEILSLPSLSTTVDSSLVINDDLQINVSLEKVYPVPNCTVQFRGRSLMERVNFSVQTSGLFNNVYFVQLVPNMSLQQSNGNCHLNITCSVSKYSNTVVDKYLENCKSGHSGLHVLYPLTAISSIIFLFMVALLIYTNRGNLRQISGHCFVKGMYKPTKDISKSFNRRHSEVNIIISQSKDESETFGLMAGRSKV